MLIGDAGIPNNRDCSRAAQAGDLGRETDVTLRNANLGSTLPKGGLA